MKHKTLLFLIFGLIIMGVMLWFIGIDEVFNALRMSNILYVILAILMEIIVYGLYTLRWEIINKIVDIDCDFNDLFPMVMLGLAVNNITPSGRGGGEPVRAYVLNKESHFPFEATFATVIADRAFDTFPFILLSILTLILVIFNYSLDIWIIACLIIAVIIVIAVVVAIVYMSINENFGIKVTNGLIWLLHKFSKKDTEKREKRLIEAVNGFQETMKLTISNKKLILYALPLSLFIWILEIARVCVVFMAFGYPVSPLIIAESFILSVLIGFIPVLPGGVGLIDGSMILLFASAGIPSGISAAATVVERLISYWMTTFLGLLTIPKYGVNVLDNITGPNEESEPEPVRNMDVNDLNSAVNNIKKLQNNTKK
ncbi:hypothetical protein BGI41_05805 [Methanobrevibacter sp. 87.7]|uniref:UPF0104 family protein n=1 Tax=Methanobrevibacter sp. 87.7 TaxID=387957 RepID=UPI000B506DA5|nr:UPF0104 family protein [Methanobrevibacter sp. 87.7]OWT32797.1 hypothetical protein BGI41_05805 [Methanobrevibacter sp. 87.7]